MDQIEKKNKRNILIRGNNGRALALLICGLLFFIIDIHAFDNIALRFVSSEGSNLATKILLHLGANVHADDDQALVLAAQSGHAEVVKTLLDNGANIDVSHGVVLAVAIKNGDMDTIKLILDRENSAVICGPQWQQQRTVWIAQARQVGNQEISKLVVDRLKPLSTQCSGSPSKSQFDKWE